jgi:CBS domain-containing protein
MQLTDVIARRSSRSPETGIGDAARRMVRIGHRRRLVPDGDGNLCGVITERDLLGASRTGSTRRRRSSSA